MDIYAADYGFSSSADAVANASALSKAINVAGEAEGGTIYLPAGEAQCAPVVIEHSDIHIKGAYTTLFNTDSSSDLIGVVRSSNVSLSDLRLESYNSTSVVYAYQCELLLSNVNVLGGKMACIFIDKDSVIDMREVTVSQCRVDANGDRGGVGVWVLRGSELCARNLVVDDCDGTGISLDAGTTDDALAEPVRDCRLTDIRVMRVGRKLANSAALQLAGAQYTTVNGLNIADVGVTGVPGHGISMEQDQSGAIPAGNTIVNATVRNVTGYAVALVGAQGNAVSGCWDGRGAGASHAQVGARGAETLANTVSLAAVTPVRR